MVDRLEFSSSDEDSHPKNDVASKFLLPKGDRKINVGSRFQASIPAPVQMQSKKGYEEENYPG